MDLVLLFSTFVQAIGFEVFFFLVLAYFLLLLLPYARKPIPLAFIIMLFVGLFLGKTDINFLFITFTFELTILMLAFYFFLKNPERDFSWFFVFLGLIAFTWVL